MIMTTNTADVRYANRHGYSDTDPFEIVRVVRDGVIEVREMDAQLDPTWKPEMIPGGFAAHCTNQSTQRWVITSNPAAPKFLIWRHKDGRWYDAHHNRYNLSDHPVRHYDYNF